MPEEKPADRGTLGQRYIDLIVCDEYQLRQMLERFVLMKRTARSMGAAASTLQQWQDNIDAIDQELAIRKIEAKMDPRVRGDDAA